MTMMMTMMKLILTSLAGATLLLAAFTGARADENCTGAISGPQPSGNVTVPNGTNCTMTDVTITGNVQVQNNATLTVTGAKIGGNVQGDNCRGLILSNDAATMFPLSVGGNVQIHNCINGLARNLSINVDPGTGTVIGNFQCQNNSGNLTCIANNAMLGHDVQVSNNSFSTGVMVTNNTIGHDLQVNNNTSTSAAQITGNTIHHDFQCHNNSPPPTVTGNTVFGNNQCP